MAAARPASQSTCTRQWQSRCQHQRARRQTSLRRRNGKNNSAHAGAIFLQGAGNHADRPVGPPGRESDPSRNVYGRDRTNTLNRAPGRPRSGGYPALAWGAQPLTRVVPSQELHRWSRQACSHNNAPPANVGTPLTRLVPSSQGAPPIIIIMVPTSLQSRVALHPRGNSYPVAAP